MIKNVLGWLRQLGATQDDEIAEIVEERIPQELVLHASVAEEEKEQPIEKVEKPVAE